jgi:hypothetical protein
MAKGEEVWTQLATRIPKELHRRIKLHCVMNDAAVKGDPPHRDEGRALRVFNGASGNRDDRGQFELPPTILGTTPTPPRPAPLTSSVKSSLFRLRTLDSDPHPVVAPAVDRLVEVAIEEQNTERVYVQPNHELYEAGRREQKLVRAYVAFMAARGSRIIRHRMQPNGEAKPTLWDLYKATRNHLVEQKGTATREAIRMAIGQLADYRRFLTPRLRCAAWLPDDRAATLRL